MSLARARSARRIKSSNTCGAESSWSRFGWVKSVVIAGLACRFDRLSRHASRAQEQTHDGIQRVYSGSYLGSPYIYVVQAFVLFVCFCSIFRPLHGWINKSGRWRMINDWLQGESFAPTGQLFCRVGACGVSTPRKQSKRRI